ncbi:O-antigen ligase family protein [bacterium]|nr:O-antigen ligase family protein [bacterium]
MKILKSKIFDIINSLLFRVQDFLSPLFKGSFIVSKIDDIIFLLISLTIISTAFLESGMLGFMAILTAFAVFIKILIVKGEKIELETSNLFFISFLIISFISVINSTLVSQSLYGFSKTLIYAAFFFAVVQFLKSNKTKIIPLIFIIFSVMTFEGIIGILQHNVHIESIATWQDTSYLNPEEVLSRVYGTLKPYNPNLLAGYLVSGLGMFFALSFLALRNKKFPMFFVILFCSLLTLMTLVFTGTRGAYIALFVFLLAICFVTYNLLFKQFKIESLKKTWNYTVGSFSLVSAGVIIATPSILKRIFSIFLMRGDSSTSFRFNVYQSSLRMFTDNWILGIGTGNKTFREIYGLYMLSGFDALSSYCIYLEIALESGIFALLAYLGFFVCLFKNGIQNFLHKGDFSSKVIVSACMLSILAVLVHGFVDTVYFRAPVQLVFWVIVAVLVVLIREEAVEQ